MQQRGGGSQYGASPTEMTPFASAATDKGHSMLGGSSDHPQQQQQLKLGDPSVAEAEVEAEAASPISSRPPATTAHSSAGNFEEPLPVPIPGGLPDEDMLAGEEVDRVGVAVGNRWPPQETLALLKIRSDLDAAFRDATLKGPLWEDVSRKLADLGYKRSAKKCKEKFENVHKYYKRTKEGRGGRQDGKSYRFFSQLEALAGSNVSAATPTMPTSTKPTITCVASSQQLVAAPLPVSIGIGIEVTNPMQVVSSIWIPPPLPPVSAALPQAPAPSATGAIFPSDLSAGIAPPSSGPATVAARPAAAAIGVSFTSDSSASSSGSEELDEDEEMEAAAAAMEVEGDLEGEQAGTRQRKRQRRSSKRVSSSSSQRMMEFFEGLMKQVMQKQEGMQQRFLETIEKREQDRMIREEAWKRQEMARLAREHELMAQERAMSASRDAAIIDFLQKITGQTIQLPQPVIIPAAPPPPPPPFPIPLSSSVPPLPPPPPPPPSEQRHHKTQQQQWQHYEQQPHHQQHQQLHHHHHPQAAAELVKHHHPTISSEVVMAVPEQQVPPQEISGGASFETSSSRWPKAEVLALIKLRSGLESRYQEAGPKDPLWEEISAGMQRMGYKRSAKRCKEKWENINKYFKKVKESNKNRPADAKTCPYFHQLDALYRKKIIGSSSGGGGSSVDGNQNRPEQQQQQEGGMMDPIPAISLQEMTDVPTIMPSSPTTELDNKGGVSSDLQTSNAGLTATLFGEGSCSGADTGAKKPEDIVKEQQQKQQTQQLLMMDCDKTDEPDNDIIDEDDVEEEDDDDDDDDEVEMNKMAYKIEFQRQNAGSSNGGREWGTFLLGHGSVS